MNEEDEEQEEGKIAIQFFRNAAGKQQKTVARK